MEKILQLYYSQLSIVSCGIKIYSSTTASQQYGFFPLGGGEQHERVPDEAVRAERSEGDESAVPRCGAPHWGEWAHPAGKRTTFWDTAASGAQHRLGAQYEVSEFSLIMVKISHYLLIKFFYRRNYFYRLFFCTYFFLSVTYGTGKFLILIFTSTFLPISTSLRPAL